MCALEKQTYPRELIEILVINNDPTSALPASLILPQNARLLEENKPGSYAARNRGLAQARGDLIGFTDSDCVPEPDWVANAVSVSLTQEDESFRITGPVRLFRKPGGSWLAWKFESITAFNQQHNVRNGVSVTANLFVTRLTFEQVGMFDARLFSGGDVAWNRLASQQGVSLVYVDDVVVNHPAGGAMSEIVSKFRRVVGGGYVQARRERRIIVFTLRYLVPPVKYGLILLNDGKPLLGVVFACAVFWGIKVLMLVEIIRLSLGGTPVRQ